MNALASIARVGGLLLTVALLNACTLFGSEKDEELEPVELIDFEETLDVRRVWSEKLGGGSEALRVDLSPAYDGNRAYAASYDGKVSALNPENGNIAWQTDLDLILTAGPGIGDGLVVVAGYDGELIALDASDGSERWRLNTGGESVAKPVISDGVVAVYTNDGRLQVFSAFDGAERWELSQDIPPLTLRGASTPVVVGNYIVAGFDNGRLVASALSDGEQIWEAIVTPPTGRSDLDRLADVDGALAVVGQDIYAAGYQGRVAALAVESGQVLWAREMSAYSGLGADWDNIYVSGEQGEIIALLRRNGSDVWRTSILLRREPTAPVAFDTAVVVGDYDGYVHFFSRLDGTLVARERVGKGMISGTPLVAGNRLLVQSESGTLSAFAVPAPRRPSDEEEIADADTQAENET